MLLAALILAASALSCAAAGRGGPASARGSASEAPEPGPIRRSSDSPPWPRDFETGLQAARAFVHYYGLVEEDSLLFRLNRVGYEVASQIGHPEILFTFHILDLPEPNALALPGGFVFVTKGMADLKLPDVALAHLLGHEMAHVTQRHFARADRLSGALSLIQTAVLVAALLTVPSSSSGGYDRDPETGLYRTSLGGKEAAVQASSLFGGVFRELLLRGYSRSMELEADDIGRRYAGRAGYSMSGGVLLMEELHQRIYEDQEYGYWRTHPYFSDRVFKAKAAVDAGGTPPVTAEVRAYRETIQKNLMALAETVEDEPTALFLYQSAMEAEPGGVPSFAVEHRLLQKRNERMQKIKEVLRAYGPLIADYDSLLVRMRSSSAPQEEMRQAESERGELDKNRADVYAPSQKILDREQAGIQFMELFLENFPDDPRAPQIRYRLAEQYRLSDRPDLAALILAGAPGDEVRNILPRGARATDPKVLKPPSAASLDTTAAWAARSEAALRKVLPLTKELTTAQRILLATASDSVRTWATVRLKAQAQGLDSLEVGSRFLAEFPVSLVSTKVREQVEELAMKRYYAARLRESLHEYQDALDGYNGLILIAPRTRATGLAKEGIERIQTLAGR